MPARHILLIQGKRAKQDIITKLGNVSIVFRPPPTPNIHKYTQAELFCQCLKNKQTSSYWRTASHQIYRCNESRPHCLCCHCWDCCCCRRLLWTPASIHLNIDWPPPICTLLLRAPCFPDSSWVNTKLARHILYHSISHYTNSCEAGNKDSKPQDTHCSTDKKGIVLLRCCHLNNKY